MINQSNETCNLKLQYVLFILYIACFVVRTHQANLTFNAWATLPPSICDKQRIRTDCV